MFCFVRFDGLFLKGDSSSILSVSGIAAIEWRFFTLPGKQDLGPEADCLQGVAPRFTGVLGGRLLSNCSGLSIGPNETLFFLLTEVSCSDDFLLPLDKGLWSFGDRDAFTTFGDKGDLEPTGDNKLSSTS